MITLKQGLDALKLERAYGRKLALEEAARCCDKLKETEFFHDGLSADLREVKDKAFAYRLGFGEALATAAEDIRALAQQPASAQPEQPPDAAGSGS